MTTTTAPDVIEGIDMDAVPVCESKYGCSDTATWIWIKTHGCRQLSCGYHRARMVEYLASVKFPRSFQCGFCGRITQHASASTVGTWVEL